MGRKSLSSDSRCGHDNGDEKDRTRAFMLCLSSCAHMCTLVLQVDVDAGSDPLTVRGLVVHQQYSAVDWEAGPIGVQQQPAQHPQERAFPTFRLQTRVAGDSDPNDRSALFGERRVHAIVGVGDVLCSALTMQVRILIRCFVPVVPGAQRRAFACRSKLQGCKRG